MQSKQWKRSNGPEPPLSSRRKKYPAALVVLTVVAVPAVVAMVVLGIFVVWPHVRSHSVGAANANTNCTLLLPAQPLSARGLATPYQFSATDPAMGPCNENNLDQSAFVQAAIYDPHSGKISTYNPLVIDKGTKPLVTPRTPDLPKNAVVGIWFGFNAANLTLKGAKKNTLQDAGCVNGLGNSLFSQFAYCNAHTFFDAVNKGIASGKVKIPQLGMAKDGLPCPTVRDFSVIDQDQSDNVQTAYLANADGQIAQFSARNQAKMPEATFLSNPSDNRLLTNFVDPALGCKAWSVPDLTDNNSMVSTLATDELQAQARQRSPVALIPDNDPMTVIQDDAGNAQASPTKTNLYRRGVDQPMIGSSAQANGTTYCQKFLQMGLPRVKMDEQFTLKGPSPAPDQATNLFTFLAMRANQSWTNLNCQMLLGLSNPVSLTMDLNGVVTGGTINTNPVPVGTTPTAGAATPVPTATTIGTAPTATVPAGNGAGGQQLTIGTAHILLDTQDGLALMAWNVTYPNHASQQIMVNVVQNSCTGSPLFSQPATTDGNSQSQSAGVMTNLQGVQTVPNNWFVTIVDPTAGGMVGCSPMRSTGTGATATLSQS